jgi:hypothetical protein
MLKFLEKVMKQTSSTGILFYFLFFLKRTLKQMLKQENKNKKDYAIFAVDGIGSIAPTQLIMAKSLPAIHREESLRQRKRRRVCGANSNDNHKKGSLLTFLPIPVSRQEIMDRHGFVSET